MLSNNYLITVDEYTNNRISFLSIFSKVGFRPHCTVLGAENIIMRLNMIPHIWDMTHFLSLCHSDFETLLASYEVNFVPTTTFEEKNRKYIDK